MSVRTCNSIAVIILTDFYEQKDIVIPCPSPVYGAFEGIIVSKQFVFNNSPFVNN